jgi:hypothetical protein
MFQITADDIALLDDEKLRAVVARLCESEVRRAGFSSSRVTWGGNQNAADGGIDVRVTLPSGSVIDDFVPRAATGFQVKKQDMPRAEILDEMRPKNVIRPSIQNLADVGGAYIIVSAEGSTSDSALTSRRDAMNEAMKGVSNADQLLLDFYDRTRIATWVRSHEGLIPWVRELVGRAIPGWHSYDSWAYAPAPLTAEYLLDDKLRIHPGKKEKESGLSPLEGIQQMRDQLREPRHVVRLVGLSGVGKTRLVQALFDERVGEHSLNPSLAIYTNMADGPDPQPIGLASNLVAAGTRTILVIDNCPPELHQRLSELCRRPESQVSVITVEYDIRDDDPEGTEVFTLDSSSPELIEKLLRQRFPNVSQIDAHTIAGAEFSGGNARIAIALASTIGKNETVAGLTDDQLFQRLFLQRHAPDESLYLAAQACSLVYSFQGEDVSDNEKGELIRLGNIIGKTPQEMYRSVAELRRRDLVQQRGVWRAVLPHAIANRLAAVALQNFPYAVIAEHLLTPSARLMKSFSRRLGYLHASNEAVAIVKKWLAVGGLLERVADFNDLGRAMFDYVAPVSPEDVLAALERTLLGPEAEEAAKRSKQHLDLLRSLAYDPALFERCVEAMVRILTARDGNEQSHATELFVSLFHLCLSGTHATIEQRLMVIEALLASPDAKRRALGVHALKGVLEASHFSSMCGFSFGARSRDYGYWPRTNEEVRHWFGLALKLVETLACADGPAAPHARAALAEKLRGLWYGGSVREELANVCRAISQKRFWPEGWLAVRQTLDLDAKGVEAEGLAPLIAIEVDLRPTDLLQRVRSVVFSTRLQGVDLEDYEDHSTEDMSTRMARTEALARDLGKAVATEEAVLDELLPEVVSCAGRLWSFGQGLVDGTGDAADMWKRLVAALTATEQGLRRPQVLAGFLHQVHTGNKELANALLEDALEHETLAQWYPFLQVSFPLDLEGVARLKRSLALGKTPVAMYECLAYGRATDPIPAPDLKELVMTMAAMPSGYDVAIEILHMRLHSDEGRKDGIAPELIDAGRDLMEQLVFTKKNDREDYRLGGIAKSCLKGAKGAAVVKAICRKLKTAVAKYETYAFDNDDLLEGLFSAQPIAALDELFAGEATELQQGLRIMHDVRIRKYPLGVVTEADLLHWCDGQPATRYPALAQVITISHRKGEAAPLQWTSIALRFLEKAPDPSTVLKEFVSQFKPASGWSGSLAAILEANATLLDDLDAYPNLAGIVAQEKLKVQQAIDAQKRFETSLDRARDERFE